jgi:serine/threonine protein kinase
MSISQLLPLSAGTFIKDYEIIELLGSGGFGVVYKAKNRNGSSVAIKETYFGNEKELKTLRDEAKLLSSLSDEDFPKVIAHFDNGKGRFYLIMELIEGDDLGDVLEKEGKPIELEKVLDWADRILQSLEYLHSKKITHRDIKPQNLKLTPKGRIKVIDLGLAKGYIPDNTKFEYVESVNAATPSFAPIEQHLRIDKNYIQMLMLNFESRTKKILEQNTDARTDIYSLGATLYCLLTNIAPSVSPIRALSVWAGGNDLILPAHEVNEKIPEEISQVLQKALEIDRENRYASSTEMRLALKEANLIIKERKSVNFENNSTDKATDNNQSKSIDDWSENETKRFEEIQKKETPKQFEVKEIEPQFVAEIVTQKKTFRPNYLKATLVTIISVVFSPAVMFFLANNTQLVTNKTTANNVNNDSLVNAAKNTANESANVVTNVSSNANLSAIDYFNKGLYCSIEKDYNCTISNYSKAIELKPTYADAYTYRGWAYYSKSNYDQAIQDFNKVIEFEPNEGNGYSDRGLVYSDKSDYDQAIQDFNKAIELQPNDRFAYYRRGSAYKGKSDYDQAIQDFNKAIELKNNFASAYRERGFTYEEKGEYNLAIADYQKALEIDPNVKNAKDNLDRVLKLKAKQ